VTSEVAARDVPDRGNHHRNREAVCERHAGERRIVNPRSGHDRPGPDEDERKRADELGDAPAQGIEHGSERRAETGRPKLSDRLAA